MFTSSVYGRPFLVSLALPTVLLVERNFSFKQSILNCHKERALNRWHCLPEIVEDKPGLGPNTLPG